MIVGTTTERPTIFSICFGNRQIVDAGQAPTHEPVFIKFPVLVPIGAKPIPRRTYREAAKELRVSQEKLCCCSVNLTVCSASNFASASVT
jgi:hypothetical protein